MGRSHKKQFQITEEQRKPEIAHIPEEEWRKQEEDMIIDENLKKYENKLN